MFVLGYNTNGFAHHQFEDTCAILAELGYRSVALTVEREILGSLDAAGVAAAVRRIVPVLSRYQLRCTIESGSRYYLDSRRKHQPTLISSHGEQREQRIRFLQCCMDLAGQIGAEGVSLWSGTADDQANESALCGRLVGGLRRLLDHPRGQAVRLGFEPEPGMFIDNMEKFSAIHDELDDERFGLTLDVGHVHCMGDGEPAEHILQWKNKLWNIHIEDMRRAVHDHLMFGEGDMNFAPIFWALRQIRYAGPVHVELSRHSHNAVEVARAAHAFLSQF